ncbi:MAG: JAB domain-containing protein [Bacteroidota bacterium]
MRNKVNELQVSYIESPQQANIPKIQSSEDAFEVLYGDWDKNTIALKESFKILLLNNANQVKGIYEISQGGITGTLVDLRILYAVILKSLSVGIILAHNHPSGNLNPSLRDKEITNKIREAGQLFDIILLDHLILTPFKSYYSFADEGLL